MVPLTIIVLFLFNLLIVWYTGLQNRDTVSNFSFDTLLCYHLASGVASYGALGHVPPSTSNNFFLVHFGVNLTAVQVLCGLP